MNLKAGVTSPGRIGGPQRTSPACGNQVPKPTRLGSLGPPVPAQPPRGAANVCHFLPVFKRKGSDSSSASKKKMDLRLSDITRPEEQQQHGKGQQHSGDSISQLRWVGEEQQRQEEQDEIDRLRWVGENSGVHQRLADSQQSAHDSRAAAGFSRVGGQNTNEHSTTTSSSDGSAFASQRLLEVKPRKGFGRLFGNTSSSNDGNSSHVIEASTAAAELSTARRRLQHSNATSMAATARRSPSHQNGIDQAGPEATASASGSLDEDNSDMPTSSSTSLALCPTAQLTTTASSSSSSSRKMMGPLQYDPDPEITLLHKMRAPQQPDASFWGGFLGKCRMAYDVFFPPAPAPPRPVMQNPLSPKEVVMSRLQMVLVADRCGISPEMLVAMKNRTVSGLAKYMDADLTEMEMQVSAVKPSGERITMSLGFRNILEEWMLRDPDTYHYQYEDDDDYFTVDDGEVTAILEAPPARQRQLVAAVAVEASAQAATEGSEMLSALADEKVPVLPDEKVPLGQALEQVAGLAAVA